MKYLWLLFPIYLLSCGKQEKKFYENTNSGNGLELLTPQTLSEKKERFLWRESQSDGSDEIVINDKLIKELSDAEKAALGFIATFVGSECDWDNKANEDFSNLRCKVLSALDLGYQCSDKHIGFLKKWFKNDPNSLKELDNCFVVPFTANSQNTFDHINIEVKNDNINIQFAASGLNMRMRRSWKWNESLIFKYDTDHIILIERNKSEVEYDSFDLGNS